VQNQKRLIEEKKNTALVELQSFKSLVSSKNEIIEELERKWKNLGVNSVIDDSQMTVLNQLRKATILTPEDWKDFTESLLKVYPYFLKNLNEKYPNLTPAETRYLSLTKLKLSSQEMASTLGVSNDAIRKMKSRLKKKINFSEKETPEDIVKSI
jgi:DNA-binding CsgD family transcriptional regulator